MATTLFDQVSIDELQRHLDGISRVVRLSGTADETKAFDYIEGQLRSFGFGVN